MKAEPWRTHWTNWAGNQSGAPQRVVWPADGTGIAEIVLEAGSRGAPVKVIGSGHSFTPIAATDGVQVRLDRLSGLTTVDHGTGRVGLLAGTPLHEVNRLLAEHDLALANLGDIDTQTLAGAISTGTHGTGGRLGGLASQVVELTLVDGSGELLHCSRTRDPELFAAACVGLGSLGILVEITLQCVPAFVLQAVEKAEPLDRVLEDLDQSVADHDHFEFYWFPYTDLTSTKRNDRLPPDAEPRPIPRWRTRLEDDFLTNTVYEWVNRLGHTRPAMIPTLNALSARAVSARRFSDVSHRVFATPRRVRFIESEYAVPAASVAPVLTELRSWLATHDRVISFPVEVRFAAADDLWLSTGFQRDNGYLAVHQYHRGDHRAYFSAFESIVAEHAGRPHWGKLHSLGAEQLRRLYPRFDDFLAVRDRSDPERLFTNAYLDHVLGLRPVRV